MRIGGELLALPLAVDALDIYTLAVSDSLYFAAWSVIGMGLVGLCDLM